MIVNNMDTKRICLCLASHFINAKKGFTIFRSITFKSGVNKYARINPSVTGMRITHTLSIVPLKLSKLKII